MPISQRRNVFFSLSWTFNKKVRKSPGPKAEAETGLRTMPWSCGLLWGLCSSQECSLANARALCSRELKRRPPHEVRPVTYAWDLSLPGASENNCTKSDLSIDQGAQGGSVARLLQWTTEATTILIKWKCTFNLKSKCFGLSRRLIS